MISRRVLVWALVDRAAKGAIIVAVAVVCYIMVTR